ncbi:hypothetical protein ElyMa_003695200 [Elysia marginata]|uniref:Uncharacterized protein n=1 Tax=Elysia marginata TaxID=1093978 RepID=A0AAV4F1U5_9GAST|nr:hypothetical protein ElyMa_003695200 [Elysia marginata]
MPTFHTGHPRREEELFWEHSQNFSGKQDRPKRLDGSALALARCGKYTGAAWISRECEHRTSRRAVLGRLDLVPKNRLTNVPDTRQKIPMRVRWREGKHERDGDREKRENNCLCTKVDVWRRPPPAKSTFLRSSFSTFLLCFTFLAYLARRMSSSQGENTGHMSTHNNRNRVPGTLDWGQKAAGTTESHHKGEYGTYGTCEERRQGRGVIVFPSASYYTLWISTITGVAPRGSLFNTIELNTGDTKPRTVKSDEIQGRVGEVAGSVVVIRDLGTIVIIVMESLQR